jgi:glycosyltransferase involved in cell wall biosynthesis
MTAVKRTDVVVRVLSKLVERGVDARLLLVGDGPDRDDLERYAHELGVIRRCLFLGYQEDVARWYNAIDALLLPSVNEGTPVSVIEALAAERPAVATEVGGTPDVIRDGVDGFLVDSADEDALAGGLAELAGDPQRRAEMGVAGRERVLERYAVDRLVDDIDRLYRRLLAGHGLKPPPTPGTLHNSG